MNRGRNLQCAIVGRLKKGHDAHGLDPDQICQIIATELLGYVNESDIIHVPPNYIICVDNPLAQEAILSEPTMHTNHFQLEMLPWCQEHEWAQLPWISGPPTESCNIHVNPLEILPVIKTKKPCAGVHRLKDSFAAAIPTDYDLRAPDFSYLMITELRSFYESKFAAFMASKEIATQIKSVVETFIPDAEKMLAHIAAALTAANDEGSSAVIHDRQLFVTELGNVIRSTGVSLPRLLQLADSVLKIDDACLNLEGFREGPPPLEIAVPPTYAERLKIIYETAIKKIHCTTPIIETVKREENRYQTYVTVNDFTRTYYGAHTKNAAAMEAAAIFYALKHLTNVQGYRVMDLNYPLLHRLVCDIDGWNKRVNVFQLFSSIGLDEVEKIYKKTEQKCDHKYLCALNVKNVGSLIQATKMLTDKLEHSSVIIAELFQNLQIAKETYAAINIGTYSPTRSVFRWGRADRPSTMPEISA